MFGQCLITPTILDAYEFAISAPPTWKSRAEHGLISKIRREVVTYPAWVEKGKAFEDTVYRICNAHDKTEQGSRLFQKVCDVCRGGKFQEKLSKSIKIGGDKVFLFGYTDVTFPGLIIDLKTTLNYSGPDKYLKGNQHLLYCYISRATKFKYIIAEWLNEHDDTIKCVHEINYVVQDFYLVENTIIERIAKFFTYLRNNGLWLDYFQTFSKN